MKELEIKMDKDEFLPGEEVFGTVILKTNRPIKCRGVKFKALGREEAMVYVHGLKSGHYTHGNEEFMNFEFTMAKEGELEPGDHRYPFSFIIPKDAIPSYAGDEASVVYFLSAWVDIPNWPDTKAKFPFYVLMPEPVLPAEWEQDISSDSREPRPPRGPFHMVPGGIHHSSREGDAGEEEKKALIDVWLERKGYLPGETISSTVRIENRTGKSLRKLTAVLRAVEHCVVGIRSGSHRAEKHSFVFELSGEEVMESQIEIPIPEGVRSSYKGKTTSLEWELRFELDVALGWDTNLSCPLVIKGPQKMDRSRMEALAKSLKSFI